jgi:hypothetical protein
MKANSAPSFVAGFHAIVTGMEVDRRSLRAGCSDRPQTYSINQTSGGNLWQTIEKETKV